MTEHGCIPNPVTRDLLFLGGHCQHSGAPPVIPIVETIYTDPSPALDETDGAPTALTEIKEVLDSSDSESATSSSESEPTGTDDSAAPRKTKKYLPRRIRNQKKKDRKVR